MNPRIGTPACPLRPTPSVTRTTAFPAKSGCLENFSGHRGGHRFQMHTIPEMRNPPGEPIHCGVSSSFIKIVGPSFVVGCLAREHVKDTAHDRMCHSDNRPILPTPCREALIQRREIRPLRPDGGRGEL